MEIFSHINELRQDGFPALRTLVLASRKVVLWAPSASYMLELCGRDPMAPSPEELLQYIELGEVQVVGREWWIRNDKQRQDRDWVHTRWVSSFDDKILEWWHEDARLGKARQKARVIAVEDETGTSWAQGQIDSGRYDVEALLLTVERSLPGYQDKANRFDTAHDKAVSVLRDARNHAIAFAQSGADRNFGSPQDEVLLSVMEQVEPGGVPRLTSPYSVPVDPAAVIGAIAQVFDRVRDCRRPCQSGLEARKRTEALLADRPELERLREWVNQCDKLAMAVRRDSDLAGDFAADLERELRRAGVSSSLARALMSSRHLEAPELAADIMFAAAAVMTGTPVAHVTVKTLALPAMRWVLEKLGWIDERFMGPRWPFYLAEASGARTRQLREELLRAMGQLDRGD